MTHLRSAAEDKAEIVKPKWLEPGVPLLDMPCLRTFMAVAQYGTITAAAEIVALSQSAASLQLQRLEEAIGTPLFHRQARGTTLTPAGQRLHDYAAKLLETNRQAVRAVRNAAIRDEITVGAAEGVVYPEMPRALREFKALSPRPVRVVTAQCDRLRLQFERAELDILLTTDSLTVDGELAIGQRRLTWIAAQGSARHLERPLPLLSVQGCVMARLATDALRRAQIPFQRIAEHADLREIEVSVAADNGLSVMAEGPMNAAFSLVPAGIDLPDLPDLQINLKFTPTDDPDILALIDQIQTAYRPG